MLNPMTNICSNILNLRNGYFCTAGKSNIQSTNTCSFDSFYVNIAAPYADYQNVQEKFNVHIKDYRFLQMIESMFGVEKNMNSRQQKLLRNRNLLLLDTFKDLKSAICFENNLIVIDCNTNANFIIPRIMPIGLYSYTRQKKCDRCSRTVISNRCFIDIDMEKFETQPIQDLNACLIDTLINEISYCNVKDCEGSEAITTTEFSEIIIIDLQLNCGIKKVCLKDIPKDLNILGIQFNLTGCMEYIGSTVPGEQIGHYVAHLLRSNNQWQRYDDMSSKISYSDVIKQIQAQVLFYVKATNNA